MQFSLQTPIIFNFLPKTRKFYLLTLYTLVSRYTRRELCPKRVEFLGLFGQREGFWGKLLGNPGGSARKMAEGGYGVSRFVVFGAVRKGFGGTG